MALYFFSDIALFNNQLNTDSFGPVSGSESTTYRITSRHKSSSDAPAFAITDGILLVQEVNGSPGLVNIVLAPTRQSGMSFSNINYFVYRGIKRSSLLTSNDIAPRATNDLTESLWLSQDYLNNVLNTTDVPGHKSLGIHLTNAAAGNENLPDTASIDDAFFRADNNFQLPVVKAGWHIGTFDKDNIGLDIIHGDARTTCAQVRNLQNTIVCTALPPTSTDADYLTIVAERAQILNYLDPVTFWSAFHKEGVRLKVLAGTSTLAKGDTLKTSVLNKYFNSNIIYFDVRNEHGYPFNYYRNYAGGFDLAFDSGSFTNYSGFDTYNWPLVRIDGAAITGSGNKCKVRIRLTKGDNDLPLLAIGQGYLFKDFPKRKNKLLALQYSGALSVPVDLAIPRHANGSVFPSYIHLSYFKQIVAPPATPTPPSVLTIKAETYVDNLFDLNKVFNSNGDLQMPALLTGNSRWFIHKDNSFVDASAGFEKGFMARTGIAEDVNSVYLFAFANGEDLKTASFAPPLLTGSSLKNDFVKDILTPLIESFTVEKRKVEVSAGNFVDAIEENALALGISDQKFSASGADIIMIAIDKQDDLPLLKNAFLQFNPSLQKRLTVRNVQTLTDVNGESYLEGVFAITGHQVQAGVASVTTINLTVKFYK